ncbi:hypothetical protein M758_7G063400 [Ceratodon purpureus]|nr:hypothetical protein M758_7G063400 [Ceratodon purpureus]
MSSLTSSFANFGTAVYSIVNRYADMQRMSISLMTSLQSRGRSVLATRWMFIL